MPIHHVNAASTETYLHDANDNVISKTVKGTTSTLTYDRNRLQSAAVAGAVAQYNYDPFGRLDTVTQLGAVAVRYSHDGFDRVVEHRTAGATARTTRYAYDPLDRTATLTDKAGTAQEKTTVFNYLGTSGEVISEEIAGTAQRSYQYSPFGERLSILTFTAGGARRPRPTSYNAHSDVEAITDEAGDTRATYGYTAYGADDTDLFTGVDKPDPANPDKEPYNVYRFNAKRVDAASGNYDMGFRDYDPGLNRFLTRGMYNGARADLAMVTDPWTMNRYAFTAGNPINRIEIDGHCWDWNCDTVGGWVNGAFDATSAPFRDFAANFVGGATALSCPAGTRHRGGAARGRPRGRECAANITSPAIEVLAGGKGAGRAASTAGKAEAAGAKGAAGTK